MNKHYNNHAVSNIIAALLLIAIAVAAAILLYVFAIGLLGSLGSGGGTQTKEEVIMEAYSFPTGGSLTVTLRNVGSATENLAKADYFVNGMLTNEPPGFTCATGSASALAPTQSCVATVTVGNTIESSLTAGAAYAFKIVTPTGGVFSYSVIYGGSS